MYDFDMRQKEGKLYTTNNDYSEIISYMGTILRRVYLCKSFNNSCEKYLLLIEKNNFRYNDRRFVLVEYLYTDTYLKGRSKYNLECSFSNSLTQEEVDNSFNNLMEEYKEYGKKV